MSAAMEIWLERLDMLGAGATLAALVLHLAACPDLDSEEAAELRKYIQRGGATNESN